MQSKGISDIEIIYNSFDTDLYLSSKSREQFLRDNNLNEKPIIYIGKNSIVKTHRTHQLIKKLSDKHQIVTTGKIKEFEGPINLDLTFDDYVNLLSYSSLTLLLTPFEEGWSRIAHESVLCGTPVIGNGSGGMKELLDLANQIIIKSDNNLFEEIKSIVEYRKRVDKSNQEKIKKFDMKYFKEEWMKVIEN